jgi:raffinose/stachyose/melibiose transport system permease protein
VSTRVESPTARPVARPIAERRRFTQSRFYRKTLVPWLFVLPILLINLAVVFGPALAAVYYSMTDWSGVGAAKFTGLDNFRQLFFHDHAFRHAFRNNVIWLFMFLTVPILMALAAAGLLAPIRRGAIFFRLTLFLPYVLPSVVIAFVWRSLMNPDRGIGAQLNDWGVHGFDKAFLGDTKTVLPAIGFVDNWHWWGFLMVLFLASMQNIPPDLYEAARLDGASRFQEFRDVTLPGIRPTLVFMIMMTSIWSFLTFDYIWILTQGGPAGASEVLSVLVYKNAFQRFEAGYAAAIGLTMSALVGIVISIFIVLRKRGWEI